MDPNTYEKLGVFYLGRELDPNTGALEPEPLLYPSRNFRTHGVIIGMTGSGKTGLGIGLLEEAALDGVPALIIDPKGDLGNLALTFPDLSAPSFQPWMDAEEAARQGQSVEQLAAATAERWKKGLAEWGEDGARIQRLKDAAEVVIYTPGSSAGRPVSVLGSFACPSAEVMADGDVLRERIASTAGSLLGLLGIDADPLSSREHILLSSLLQHTWEAGQDLDLAGLVTGIQNPPFSRLGVMDLEAFFPQKDRFGLAMSVNTLLASPTFAAWLEGDPLDIDQLLYGPDGKPRLAVLSIAHLSDRERMFFVTLLLAQLLGWMRSRPGTESLRALLYMDEMFGFLPPLGEPPSKRPLLTLLKQARAYGVGLVLATQNPVDLDYKALSNCGTWMIGRLQTDRDRDRVLQGLPQQDAATRDLFNKLDKRVFLLHDVNADAPRLFRSRWAMSYLKGPLTRPEITRLQPKQPSPVGPGPAATPTARASATPERASRPVLDPSIPCFYLPAAPTRDAYEPVILGAAAISFVDRRRGVDTTQEVLLATELPELPHGPDWGRAEELDVDADRLDRDERNPGAYAPLPAGAGDPKLWRTWERDLADALYRGRTLAIPSCAALGLVGAPAEDERSFRIRMRDLAREKRDAEVEALRTKLDAKVRTIEERIAKARQRLAKEQEDVDQKQRDTWMSVGASVLGGLLGGRRRGLSSVTSALGKASKISDEKADVARAADDVARLEAELQRLRDETETQAAEIAQRWDADLLPIEKVEIAPRKSDVRVKFLALGWR